MPGSVIGEAFIEVKPKTDGFEKSASGGVEKGLGSIASKAALVFGGALGVGAAAHFVSSFIKAGAESEKIQRVSEAIIKSTGGAAGVTAGQIDQLSTSLSNMSGVDDELIKSAENVVLTFTNIKNSAGAGNDIFNQTTQAALDMSTVLGGDATQAALQLGKALNDPAQGLSKLARSGVSFTEQQKEQVKALQASGDLLGAQKIILGEVNREFGGAAAAAADPFQRMKVASDNLKEAIGSGLIPVLAPAATAIANFINDHTTQITNGLQAAIHGVVGAVQFLIPGFENLAKAAGKVIDVFTPLVEAGVRLVQDVFEKLNPSLDGAAKNSDILATSIAGVVTALAGLKAAQAASQAVTGLTSSLGTVAPLLANPYVLVAAAIVAIAVAAVFAYQKFQGFRDVVDATAGFFVDLFNNALPTLQKIGDVAVTVAGQIVDGFNAALPTLQQIGSTIADAFGTVVDVASGIGSAISDGFSTVSDLPALIGPAIDAITGALAPAVQFLSAVWAKYGDQVTGILVGFRDIAVAVFQRVAALLGIFITQIGTAAGILADAFGPALAFIVATVDIALAPLGTVISGALAFARVAFETFVAVIVPMWTALWSLVSDVVSNVVGPIGDVIEGLLGVIQGVVDIIAGIFTLDWDRIWSGVGEIANSAVEIVIGVLQGLLGFLDAVWSNILTLLTLPFTTAWTVIGGVISEGVIIAQTAFQGMLDYLSSVWSNIGTLITAPIEIAVGIVQGLLGEITGFFTALPTQITDALSSFPSLLVGAGTALVNGLFGAISGAWEGSKSFFTNLGSTIAGLVGDLGSALVSAGGALIDGFIAGVGAVFGGVIHFFSTLPDTIIGFVGDLSRTLWDAGVALIQGLIDGIKSKAAEIPGLVAGILSNLNPLNHLPSISLPSIPGLPIGASGGIIPGAPGAPFPMIAHGNELLLNPKQLANFAWNLANAPALPVASGGGGGTFIDARFINEGTIFGVEDLNAHLDAHADRLADIVSSGRRGSLG